MTRNTAEQSCARSDQKAYLFATVMSAFNTVIDATVVGFSGVWSFQFAAGMLAKLDAALAGTCIGVHRSARPASVEDARSATVCLPGFVVVDIQIGQGLLEFRDSSLCDIRLTDP